MLNDEGLFGCPDSSLVTGCEEEFDKVFGERGVEYERYVLCIFCFFNTSNIYFCFSDDEIDERGSKLHGEAVLDEKQTAT